MYIIIFYEKIHEAKYINSIWLKIHVYYIFCNNNR